MAHIEQEVLDSYTTAAWQAFNEYRKLSFATRKSFLYAIADELETCRTELVDIAHQETHLTLARLNGELSRTIFQLKSYGDAAVRGEWLQASIDTADPARTPAPKPDVRKTLVPLGPVLVFGASNFPFAYSTAGGDTASALAAGCPVIIKAHSAHRKTSCKVADCIEQAALKCNMPPAIFQHLDTTSRETVHAFIKHKYIKAIGFTGSFTGGKLIWQMANEREEPIPVYAEMSSINPIYLFEHKIKQEGEQVAAMVAGSITLGAGQFCTNPGLLIGITSPVLEQFIELLGQSITAAQPAAMLHNGIASNFRQNRDTVLMQQGVAKVAESSMEAQSFQDIPTVARVHASSFLQNPILGTEVFGSFSLIIECENADQMLQVAKKMEGQLTTSLMATEKDVAANVDLLQEMTLHCGRIIYNQVPTGVEVCLAMNHGGPWPSTTDAKFTSVGADALKRFARPLSFQNFPEGLLPAELQAHNPLEIYRTVNNVLTKDAL